MIVTDYADNPADYNHLDQCQSILDGSPTETALSIFAEFDGL